MWNQFRHIDYIINLSGRKAFPWVVMTASGTALAYFKNARDADAYCATLKA